VTLHKLVYSTFDLRMRNVCDLVTPPMKHSWQRWVTTSVVIFISRLTKQLINLLGRSWAELYVCWCGYHGDNQLASH